MVIALGPPPNAVVTWLATALPSQAGTAEPVVTSTTAFDTAVASALRTAASFRKAVISSEELAGSDLR
jgi:hypothetical protein